METGVRCLFFPRACELRDGHGSTRGEPGEEAYHKGNNLGGRTAVAFVLVTVLIDARDILFRLFTTDASVVQIGSDMLMFIIPWYIVYVFIEVLGGSLRGRGNVLVPVVITLRGVCVLRIIWLAGVMEISPTIHAIIFSYPVTWVVTALAFIGYYFCKNRHHS